MKPLDFFKFPDLQKHTFSKNHERENRAPDHLRTPSNLYFFLKGRIMLNEQQQETTNGKNHDPIMDEPLMKKIAQACG